MRILRDLFHRPEERPVPRYCEAADCRRSTNHGKPLCTLHVLQMPYMQALAQEMASHTKADAQALRGRADVTCERAQDLVATLEAKPLGFRDWMVAVGLTSRLETALEWLAALTEANLIDVWGARYPIIGQRGRLPIGCEQWTVHRILDYRKMLA